MMKKYFGRKALWKILISLCFILSLFGAVPLRSLPAMASAARSDGSLCSQLDTALALPREAPEAPQSDNPFPSLTPEAEQAPSPSPERIPAQRPTEVEHSEEDPDPETQEETTEEEPVEEAMEEESSAAQGPEDGASGEEGEGDEAAPQTSPPPEDELKALPEETPEAELPAEIQEISLKLELTEPPVLAAGGEFDIPLSLLVSVGERVFATNGGVLDGHPLTYDSQISSTDYDQSLTQYLQEITLFLPEQAPEGLPLDWSTTTLEGDIVRESENQGYTLLQLSVTADATPGTYILPLWARYTPAGSEGSKEATLNLTLRVENASADGFTFMRVMGRSDAVIVTTHAELRAALKTNLYSTIYLGYTEENQGTIAYADAAGLPIARDTVIDGTDPLSGHRMHLVDYPSSGSLDGLYASVADLTITVQNVDITGYNYYGVMYGTNKSGISLHFRNVNYRGRQIAHNVGANSLVTFTDCAVEISNMRTGTSQEVVEAPSVNFYESNDITRTGPETHALFNIYGPGDKTLTIASGASVRLQTTDHMFYTDNSAKLGMQVYGDLRLTTTGSRGAATYLDMYLGQLDIYPEGSLTIDHQNTQRPTLRVLNLQVQGNLRLTRLGSTLPVLVIESGGNATFDNPRTVVLQNPRGALIRSVAGSPKMTITTQAFNRYQGGSLDSIWNNVNLSPFTTGWTLATGGGSLNSVSGLESGNRGAAIGAAAITSAPPSLMSDTALHFGHTILALNQVGAGGRIVTGTAVSGASIEVREYACDEEQGLGSLLQSRTTKASGGAFTLSDQPLDNPITFPGSRVYAIGDKGTLVAHTYTDPVVTGPVFLEVPENLPFGTTRLSVRDQLIPRLQADWRLVVYDPRQSGEGFQLYAQVIAPFATSTGDTLEDGLVLAEGQAITAFGEEPLLISRGDTGDVLDTYVISWAANQGLLARLPAFEGIPGVPYEATIIFTLILGP